MDTPWNRAVGFPAGLMRHAERMAAQHRRATEVTPPVGSRMAEPNCGDIVLRQTVPAMDRRDPRVVGA